MQSAAFACDDVTDIQKTNLLFYMIDNDIDFKLITQWPRTSLISLQEPTAGQCYSA